MLTSSRLLVTAAVRSARPLAHGLPHAAAKVLRALRATTLQRAIETRQETRFTRDTRRFCEARWLDRDRITRARCACVPTDEIRFACRMCWQGWQPLAWCSRARRPSRETSRTFCGAWQLDRGRTTRAHLRTSLRTRDTCASNLASERFTLAIARPNDDACISCAAAVVSRGATGAAASRLVHEHLHSLFQRAVMRPHLVVVGCDR